MKNKHLITVDELRAAGALDVPPAWRKSLGVVRVERHLFSDLEDEDNPLPETEQSTLSDPEGDESTDEAG